MVLLISIYFHLMARLLPERCRQAETQTNQIRSRVTNIYSVLSLNYLNYRPWAADFIEIRFQRCWKSHERYTTEGKMLAPGSVSDAYGGGGDTL